MKTQDQVRQLYAAIRSLRDRYGGAPAGWEKWLNARERRALAACAKAGP